MAPHRSTIYVGLTAGLSLTLVGIIFYAAHTVKLSEPIFERKKTIVRQLGLTDLCLFTEANYTRHISMTDISTPFQDSPMSFEHFPTGALIGPPPHIMNSHVQN